jgi:hypothetical protein
MLELERTVDISGRPAAHRDAHESPSSKKLRARPVRKLRQSCRIFYYKRPGMGAYGEGFFSPPLSLR